ncbi:MAG: hypothetical protein ACP5GL_07480 [Infirmifilum sp.]
MKNKILVCVSISREEQRKIVESLKKKPEIFKKYSDLVEVAFQKCGDLVPRMEQVHFPKTDFTININLDEDFLLKIREKCYEKGYIEGLFPAYSKFVRALLNCYAEIDGASAQPGGQVAQPEAQPPASPDSPI